MSPPRESQGSTKIARQSPINRISQRTQNSVIPRRASKNNREFDVQSFLATIGEGRKAILFPKKHTIFTQGDPADAVFYLQKIRGHAHNYCTQPRRQLFQHSALWRDIEGLNPACTYPEPA